MLKQYSDPLLQSLSEVLAKNPNDLNFKKYFANELYKKGELRDAYLLFLEILDLDSDVNIERAVSDIEQRIDVKELQLGSQADEVLAQNVLKALGKVNNKEKITFASVAGMELVKDAIRTDILYPLQHPELYQLYSKHAGGGILMYGPPGCGKTFIAKATAGEIDSEFISISIHEIISAWTGEGEKFLHSVFERARKAAPCVLFFDEIDAIGANRTRAAGGLRTLVNQFLVELDGIGNSNKDVLTIAATNLPWEVDDALKRPGRFDRVLFVAPPDPVARKRLFQLHLADKPTEEINYERLALLTTQFSSADIMGICSTAGETAFKEAIKKNTVVPISQELLEEIAAKSRSSIIDWLATAKNYVTYSNQSGIYDSVKKYLEHIE